MAVNKVIYGTNTLIDLSNDTVTADKLASGYTAHDKSGAKIVGTMPYADSVLYEYAPLICQGMLDSEEMVGRYTHSGNAYSPLELDSMLVNDFCDMTGLDCELDDFFDWSIASSSSTCVISMHNCSLSWNLLVFIKVTCTYIDLSGEQTQSVYYQSYALADDEDTSESLICSGSDQVWKAEVEGLRWYCG